MKFFNLRYECLDAQDDFHVELINGKNGYSFGEIDNGIYNERSHLYDIKDNEEMSWMGTNMIASILEGSWVKQPKQCLVK